MANNILRLNTVTGAAYECKTFSYGYGNFQLDASELFDNATTIFAGAAYGTYGTRTGVIDYYFDNKAYGVIGSSVVANYVHVQFYSSHIKIQCDADRAAGFVIGQI